MAKCWVTGEVLIKSFIAGLKLDNSNNIVAFDLQIVH